MTAAWESEILTQLDARAAEYDFPVLDNVHFRGAGCRLTAFLEPAEWLVTFEEIGVSVARGWGIAVSAYGNRVAEPGTQGFIPIGWKFVADPAVPSRGGAIDCTIEGRRVLVRLAGDGPPESGAAPDSPDRVGLLRAVVASAGGRLFLPEDMLLAHSGRTGPPPTRLIQTDGWHHPDVAGDELPSQIDCLRSLALSIARGNADLFRCPEEEWNTHWSNWPSE